MTDIVVIGGGIAGVSAAARLAPEARVTLLEAETSLGFHATGRSAAAFLANYGNPVVRALNHASADELHARGVLSPRGMYLVGKAGEEERFAVNAAGFGLDEVSLSDAVARVPILNTDTVTRVAGREDVFDLDTDLFLQGFVREVRDAGAEIVTGARIDSITRDGGRWTLRAGDRDWQADVIVNAAGAWADEVAALAGARRIGLQPYRRSMARIPAPGGHDVSRWPFMDGVDDAWYAKPDAGALLVSPSEEDPVPPQDAWADDMVLAEGLARYEEAVTEPVTRMLANWAGLRTFAPDRTLVIGPDAHVPGFIWCAGQGGYGFQTAVAASRLVAAHVLGHAPDLDHATVTALSPRRFA
ncbi:NAD(P)/FAD-dependent oxidoreductase [Mesobacterium pallidum]|uniref:NAD(P)/FAD-dependent oxidoreductase n=1 Tax=Mesobacterium pallidum TaxID=2872037 RepID=UPI001EE22981|nr:FAD-binding oxidoreductase [Mesobacterium pallidum]